MLPTKYASFFKRLVAYIVDGILAKMIAALVLVPLALVTAGGEVIDNIFGSGWHFDLIAVPYSMLGELCEGWFGSFAPIPAALFVFWILLFKVIVWLYFAIFESSPRQATPGKMMLGLFVTDIHGHRLTFPRALGRTLGKILSKIFCFMGYIMALFTPRNQALHDLIAGTLVLEPAYPAPAMAPPPATPPGTAPAPDPAGVKVPAQQAPAAGQPENVQPQPEQDLTGNKPEPKDLPSLPEQEITEEKPDQQDSGEDKPEQENK